MEEEDNDVWTDNGECTICRTKTESAEEKEEHRKSKNHLKKYKVHSFFRDDISMFQTPNVPSELLERYKLRKTPVVGLQQCIEIQQLSYMEQNKSNFWACSICYVAGDSFETADIHLRSMNHVRNYLIEEEESQAESIDSYTDECDKYEMYQSAAISNFEKNGGIEGLQPPDILRMDRKSVFIREKLGIPEEIDDKMTFQPCDQENKSILNCSTCYEVFPINTTGKKHTIEKARGEHCEHPNHRRCSEIKGIIQEFDPEEKMIEYRTTERQSDLHWQKTDLGYMLSQPCGIRYVLSAGDDKMCMLCCSIVGSSTVDHCSGEFHAMKYLNLIHSNNSYLAHQLLGDERRQKIIDILRQAMDLGNDTRIVCRYLSRLPDSLKQQLAPEMLAYPEPPQIVNTDYQETTGKIFVLCHSCTTYIEFDVNSVDTPGKMSVAWLKHVKSAEHFDAAAMKARIHFYPEMFVPYPPTIRMDDAHQKGTWNLTKDIPVQTQCDVGLEFMVEDENDNEVICRCCWQVFNRNLHGLVTQHIRSYDHLKQYMFHQAPDSASFLLGPESDQKKRDFALDWLQKNNGSFPKRMAVYSKSKALELANWSPVKQRMVQTALSVPDSDKDVYETVLELVDKVAADGAETPLVTAREALVAAQMLITNTTRGLEKEIQSVICRCLDCDQLLIVNSATWQRDVFTNHVGSDEHHRRAAVFKQNLMSDFGFLDVMSTNNVKPFVQTDPNKKCIWQWNSTTKKHDYVASTVGVDDIIERRYPDPNGEEAVDFLCVLCAKIFPKRAIALQSHVREIGHCINWIHKHRDKQIRELTAHLEGSDTAEKSKELRKYLTTILKDVDKSQDYCIRVYDPYGKEREIQNEIVLKIQAQEKLKKSVEAKAKREAEQQKAADERKEYLKQQIEENVRRQNMKLKQKAEEEKARKLKEEERKERLRYAREQLAAKERTVSREDMELQKRLQSANQIQDKMQGLRNIDIRQAKLEAERIRLASRMPVQMVPPPRSVHDPQLVIMPQLVSKNVTLAEQMLIPNCPPPVFPPFPQHGMHMNPHNPYAIPPPPQNTGRPGFSMSFPPKIADSPAVQKRPSLRGQRVDPTIHDISRIKHKADLLTYMRGAQATEILNAELPRDFMRSIQDNENAFGMTYVAEVICLDEPELDSYICMICDHWASPRGMVRHLCDKEHKQKFLFKNFPDYHTQYVREKNPEVRRIVFKNIISDLKRKNKGNEMSLRMNTLIDKATIERLWPGYEDHFYAAAPKDQWTSSSFQQVSGPSVSVPNAVPLITLSDNSDEEKETRSRRDRRDRRDRSRSRDRLRRSRSRSRDRRRRRSSRSRSRSRSRDRDHRSDRDRSDRDRDRDRHRRDRRERSRSRSRTRSRSSERDRHQTPPPVSGSNIHHVGSFLSQLDELRPSNSSSTSSKPRESAREESSRKLANVRDMMQAGTIQGTPLSFATQETIAPIVQHPGIPVQPAKDERRVARDNEEHGRNLKQKMIAVMMEMEKMIVDYGGNVPRHAILEMYQSFGLNPEDGDREINMLLQDMRKIKSGENKATLNDSISQLGIPLNQPQYQQSQSYGIPQYSAPAPAPIAPPTQYGIAPSGPSAYAQAFHVTPTASASAPAPAPIAPAPTTSSSTQQPFYKNPPTSMASEPVVDKDNKSVTSSADDDDDYSDVYQVLGGTKKKGLIPGQKMALKRTILPSGARVEEEKPAAVTSSPSLSIISEPVTPTKQPAPAPVTQPPALETSFGIPAPVSITTAPPPQQTYATTQMYQTLQQQQPQTTYQYQQPPPQQQYQMYQQPPPMVQQQQQPVQYGIPNTFQQPPPMQQYGAYQQQQMQMNPQSMYQPPPQIQQWPPTAQVPQQQVYYQQPPPNAQQYGISAPNPANPNQQYYTYQR